VRALPVDGQALPVPEAPVAAKVHQTLDVLLNLAPKIAFDLELGLEDVADRLHLGIAQLLDLFGLWNLGAGADVLGALVTDTVDVSEREAEGLATG
jgi:hypothetical protein